MDSLINLIKKKIIGYLVFFWLVVLKNNLGKSESITILN